LFDDNMPEGWEPIDWVAAKFWANPELHREMLYESGAHEHSRLQELANGWLTELAEVGLLELDPDQEAPLKQADNSRPTLHTREGELYTVRVEGHRQLFWVQVNARPLYGDRRGYKPIRVLDKPLRTQTAIISLLTTLEASPIDAERLREELSQENPLIHSVQYYSYKYVLSLLRYYRPTFDELPHQDQLDLIVETCNRMNSFFTASRQLVEFLEYGVPSRDLRPAIENANRDVNATVLRDVEGLSLSQIAKRLGLSTDETDEQNDKRDYPQVRQMIKRGKKLLEGALGEDGWRKQIEVMKADRDWFRSLNTAQQRTYTTLDRNRMTEEEARQYVARYG